MVLYICPVCGDVFRLPDAAAPLFCQGTEGIDQHEVTQAERFVVVPREHLEQAERARDEARREVEAQRRGSQWTHEYDCKRADDAEVERNELRGRLEQAEARCQQLEEAAREAVESLGRGPLKDGYAYAVLEEALRGQLVEEKQDGEAA